MRRPSEFSKRRRVLVSPWPGATRSVWSAPACWRFWLGAPNHRRNCGKRTALRPRHEPQRRAGIHPPQYCYGGRVLLASVGNADGSELLALARSPGRLEACPTLGPLRSMVPLHAQERKEAFQKREQAPALQTLARPALP